MPFMAGATRTFALGFNASATQLKPDGKYKSILASKFINCLMYDGKKSVAQNVFYGALDIIKEKIADVEPIEAFRGRR